MSSLAHLSPAEQEADRRRRRALGAGPNDWIPNPGPQEAFLACPAFEVMTGGAMGGSKTEGGLAGALRMIDNPNYTGMIMRKQYGQLVSTILPRAAKMYAACGGVWRSGIRKFIFPSGASILLGAADHEGDVVKRFQGIEVTWLYIDELTQFDEATYRFMISRLRSSHRLPCYIRSGSNPGGEGAEWVMKRFAPWLYPNDTEDYHGPRAEPGKILWMRKLQDSEEEVVCSRHHPDAMSRTYIPAKISDTPQLRGSKYEAMLNTMSRVERKRYRDGDWMARDAAGEFFERGWFLDPETDRLATVAPLSVIARVRYWDLASTPANRAKPSSAWTAGVLLSKTDDGLIWIEDIVRGQWSPGRVEAQILATAEGDPAGTRVMIEHDPGQAGDAQAVRFAKLLVGFDFGIVRPQGDKLARARPASASAEAHNIRVVKGAWNNAFFVEAESFPEATKDQIDGLSGAHGFLAKIQRSPFGRRSPRGNAAATVGGGFA